MSFKHHFITVTLIGLLAISCGDGAEQTGADQEDVKTEGKVDHEAALLEIEGKMFSFPSPVQTALLLKEVGGEYDAGLLNEPGSVSNYSTSFKKSINLGIYGADLGYVTIYEQTQDAISYLASAKKLADDLDVAGAFDESLIKRFEQNIGNKDSLLCLVADAFRASDAFLKNNDRNDVGTLVLAGGWVESLYFSSVEAEKSGNQELITRIGAQKNTCENLVKLMMPYYNKAEYTPFIDQLMELNDVFSSVEIVYTYKEPTTDEANKKTIINSVTDIRVSDEQLKDIIGKIKIIRQELIS